MPEKSDITEVDFRRVLFALLDHLWIILLVGVLIGAMAFGYAYFFVTPQYSASTQLYVNNNYVDSPGFTSSQLQAAQNLAYTYMVILESRTVMEEVAEESGLDYTYSEISAMIKAEPINETEVFEVTVTCENYKHAAIIANAVAHVLPERISSVVEGSSVRVVDYARESSVPVGPVYKNYAMIGAAVGILLTALVVIVVDLMDTSVSSEEYLEKNYPGVPLLAVIPSESSMRSSRHLRYNESADKHTAPQKRGGGQ